MNRADDEGVRFWWNLLSLDEKERARRFRFEDDYRSFVIARGVLRRLLAAYLDCPASELEFEYDDCGKPSVKATTPIAFNLSHSGDLVAVAVAAEAVGIDVEQLRPLADIERIVTSFFSAEEMADILAVSQGCRAIAFFRCWTRKEAFLKGVGSGLSASLDTFSVPALPEAGRFLVARAQQSWMLTDLRDVPPGYVGTVACSSMIRHVRALQILTSTMLIPNLV